LYVNAGFTKLLLGSLCGEMLYLFQTYTTFTNSNTADSADGHVIQ